MKKAVVFLYVVGVLIASGVAKAESQVANLPISKVTLTEGTWQINVQGPVSNPCISSTRAIVETNKDLKLTFNLRVVGNQTGDFCAQVIQRNYNLAADLRDMVSKTGVKIRPGVTYTVIADGTSFEIQFKGEDLLSSASDQVRVTGVLVANRQGQLALLTLDQKMVLVDGSNVEDGQLYINKNVTVDGQFGPLQESTDRYVAPSHDQRILPVVRLMAYKIQPLEK